MNAAAQIESHYGLFLSHLIQARDNELILFLSEARVNYEEEHEVKFNEDTENPVVLKTNPIRSDKDGKKYKVTFRDFVVYEIAEEASLHWDGSEEFQGKLFRRFLRSRFLDHVEKDLNTGFYEEINGRKQHFQFPCLNYIVDIISAKEPVIEEVSELGI
jgi:hypothetical protein